MKTAIVILNWNGAHMLRQYLSTVLAHCPADAEVWVADNASTDNSMALLRAEYPTVKTLQLDRNYGFAEGYNRALRQIEAQYYVLLNSDVETTPGWLSTLTTYLDQHPDVAACQPKLRALAQPSHFEYAGACGGYLDLLGYPFCRGRIFDTVEADQGQYDEPADVLWATGACLVVRATDYWEAGALDGRFFAHNEEIDLCWRLRLMGRRVVCLPQSHVFHLGGGTLPKGNPRKTYLNFRNNLTMLYKNLPKGELLRVMLLRMVLDYVAALQALLMQRNWAECRAIVRGRWAFLRWHRQFAADRKRIQQTRKADTADGRTRISIIWQYYAKGRKTFRQLTMDN